MSDIAKHQYAELRLVCLTWILCFTIFTGGIFFSVWEYVNSTGPSAQVRAQIEMIEFAAEVRQAAIEGMMGEKEGQR
jgi:hypothetical protein